MRDKRNADVDARHLLATGFEQRMPLPTQGLAVSDSLGSPRGPRRPPARTPAADDRPMPQGVAESAGALPGPLEPGLLVGGEADGGSQGYPLFSLEIGRASG